MTRPRGWSEGSNVKISQLYLKSMKCESYKRDCLTRKGGNLQRSSSKMELMNCVTDYRGQGREVRTVSLK